MSERAGLYLAWKAGSVIRYQTRHDSTIRQGGRVVFLQTSVCEIGWLKRCVTEDRQRESRATKAERDLLGKDKTITARTKEKTRGIRGGGA